LLFDLAFAHGSRQKRIADQETGPLVKAHDWVGRLIGQCIERQYLFEMGQERRINPANTPGLFEMRL
jgi:hypothetical protein